MGMEFRPVILLCVLVTLFISSSAQTCRNSNTFAGNRNFATCNDLPVLNSFLHWTYNPSNRTVNLAFRKTGVSDSSWVAYALNPTGRGMIGAQALVAYQNGGTVRAYTAPVAGLATTLQEGTLSFPVDGLSAEYANNVMTIYATVTLPGTSSTINQVWQEGPLNGNSPAQHALASANRASTGNINFATGQSTAAGGGANAVVKRRNVHGVLNAVSWGTLMPLGAIIARYLKVAKSADPAWFYLHIACQSSAYAVGVAGWATGLKLGSESKGIQYDGHRNIGIALFCLGTLQVFALLLRPKPDHKYRVYWNVYHHTTGYLVLILSVVNVYKGLNILNPDKMWKRTYTGVIVTLAAIAIILEALTWAIVIKRKKSAQKSQSHMNGANGNGYGARPQQVV